MPTYFGIELPKKLVQTVRGVRLIILGVAFLSDASACVLKDGELVAAISEERLNRVKQWSGVPRQAIGRVLEIAGIRLDQVDFVATHGAAPMAPDAAPFDEKKSKIEGALLSSGTKSKQLEALAEREAREQRVLGERTPAYLAEIAALGKQMKTYPHHQAHAASAFYGSGWDECYAMTADGWGEDASSTIWHCRDGAMELVSRSHTFDSLGYFYGSITKSLGFIPHRHEGKVLGLAAYCRGDNAAYPVIRDMICYDPEHRRFLGQMENGVYKPRYDNAELDLVIVGHSRESVAAAAQRRLEEVVCEAVLGLGGQKERLALAGGVFANVKLNQRVRELSNIDDVYVFPNMGDGGLSIGAAWLAHQELTGSRPQAMHTALLGNDLTDEEICQAIAQSGLSAEQLPNINHRIASLLADGHVVARAAGRMEFGPRALGNRSILYRCDEPDVNQWLNARLARSEFMPFAPASLSASADSFYLGLDGGRKSAPYMTMTFDCTPRMIQESPAAVHVDGTARPQLVDPVSYPGFHEILTRYFQLSGKSSVVNTSFNMHEEPIVCSAVDAIRAFQASSLPWLALGDYLVASSADAISA